MFVINTVKDEMETARIRCEALADMNWTLPAARELKLRGTARRKAKVSAVPRSWKNQTKARSQWARHMEGPCRCYTEKGESSDTLFLRLARDGFPVAIAN